MGRKKTKAIRKPTKITQKLPSCFDCPFCNNPKTVETKLEKKRGIGTLNCRMCQAHYATRVAALAEPVDVYGDWIDKCQAENRRAGSSTPGGAQVGE